MSMKKHNFYAGPSILSQYTIQNTADAIINFADTGLSPEVTACCGLAAAPRCSSA